MQNFDTSAILAVEHKSQAEKKNKRNSLLHMSDNNAQIRLKDQCIFYKLKISFNFGNHDKIKNISTQ